MSPIGSLYFVVNPAGSSAVTVRFASPRDLVVFSRASSSSPVHEPAVSRRPNGAVDAPPPAPGDMNEETGEGARDRDGLSYPWKYVPMNSRTFRRPVTSLSK